MISFYQIELLKDVINLYFFVLFRMPEKTGVAMIPINIEKRIVIAVIWFES